MLNQMKSVAYKTYNNSKRVARAFEKKIEANGMRSPIRRDPSLSNKLSIIVPTYNVEQYLPEFLASVTSQSSSLHNLEVIIVNDGTPDNSGVIAQSWAKKYPKNIRYIEQENKGLCGARNTGLKHATGDWVSFPDPDDFFHRRYLHIIDNAIKKGAAYDVALLVANFIVFDEAKGRTSNRHGLNYRFKNTETRFKANNMQNHVHMAVNSAFFRRDIIQAANLTFDERIKPGFEDAHFTNLYLLKCQNQSVFFLKDAIYYYRKRIGENSLQDKAKTKFEFYDNQLRYGWLDLFEKAKTSLGYIPRHIQNTVLYDTIGRLDVITRVKKFECSLTDTQRHEYKNLLKKTYEQIDSDVIETTTMRGFYEPFRVGCLNLFKGLERNTTTIYMTDYSKENQFAEFQFYNGIKINNIKIISETGAEVPIANIKCTNCEFFDEIFYYQHTFYAHLPSGNFHVLINDKETKLVVNKTSVESTANRNIAVSAFSKKLPAKITKSAEQYRSSVLKRAVDKYKDCWLIMDRTDKADDNGEHFYRFLQQNHPEQPAFFIINKTSTDWQRLKKEGFHLIDYLSLEHCAALTRAKWLISSHGDRIIREPFADNQLNDLFDYRFAFLQHGVTIHDQSEWFNFMKPALLITATKDEHKSIVSDGNSYSLTDEKVKLTGFPRHDALINSISTDDVIFIMPTWRKNLGEVTAQSNSRELTDRFNATQYAKSWRNLLHSNELRDLATQNNLKVVFCPHPNFTAMIQSFDMPDHIQVVNSLEIDSLQPWFLRSAVLITDYSSVSFEAAYLNKPVIYFQFDRDTFYTDHIYRPGYFNYETHGFGPVSTTVENVTDNLAFLLGGLGDKKYEERRIQAFPYRDGKCSERIYKELNKL